ncbi:MAG: hypothetical protein M0Q41_02135 [Bacteroidales bacterium]|nr:hypothetical protein [Acholeplasmataceae bacterium]MCK9447756.1 hypothetical protein [Bacteroidales bacterium]
MSEITERKNIISITEMNVQDIHASMVNLKEMSTYQPLNIVLSNNMDSYIPSDVISTIQSTTGTLSFTSTAILIKSPNAIRASFQEVFAPTLSNLEAKGVNPIVARKATLLETLKKMDFKVKENASLDSNLKAVFKAKDMKVLNTEIKSLMHKLKVYHTEVFVENMATACAIASKNIGFRDVEIKTVQGKLEVIASNSQGQHLLSEISLDSKTNQVNANTETIGITDGNCTTIIQSFNEELRKMNIKIGEEKNTFTGGVCQMSYAKIIDKQAKVHKRRKELERIRKLNSNKQIKN